MTRLRFIVEGRTEANFVNSVLVPHLAKFGVAASKAQMLSTGRVSAGGGKYSGGAVSWERAGREISRLLVSDRAENCLLTTMFDYYAIPSDFPGLRDSDRISDPYGRIAFLEKAMQEEVGSGRFIPYLQLHEFEALVFADVSRLSDEYFGAEKAIKELEKQALQAGNPELVDGGRDTAPSKRLARAIPQYDKANGGPLVVESIGLDVLRKKCRHFGEWLEKLESLGDVRP